MNGVNSIDGLEQTCSIVLESAAAAVVAVALYRIVVIFLEDLSRVVSELRVLRRMKPRNPQNPVKLLPKMPYFSGGGGAANCYHLLLVLVLLLKEAAFVLFPPRSSRHQPMHAYWPLFPNIKNSSSGSNGQRSLVTRKRRTSLYPPTVVVSSPFNIVTVNNGWQACLRWKRTWRRRRLRSRATGRLRRRQCSRR